MELLIPGLILVALMVYASTKIKKNAARAYEPERIDNDQFSIAKPAGFIHVLNGKKDLAFQAYTKDFGDEGTADCRRASVELRMMRNADVESVWKEIRSGFAEITSDERARIGERNYQEIRGTCLEKGIAIEAFYKLIAVDNAVAVLQVSVLPEYIEEFRPNAEEFLDSFELK